MNNTKMLDWMCKPELIGNHPEALDSLIGVIRSNEAVSFSGAGTSAPIYPTWQKFLDILLLNARSYGFDVLRSATLAKQKHRPLFVAEEIFDWDKDLFFDTIEECYGVDRAFPIHTSTHELLMELPFSAYVTTNYDNGLEQARTSIYPTLKSFSDTSAHVEHAEDRWRGAGGEAFKSGLKEILHLHGSFNERNNIVLTQSQYRRAYKSNQRRILESLWERRGIVFSGFSFQDPWINFLAELAIDGLEKDRRHFAILGVSKIGEEDDAYFRKTFGIQPIFYPIKEGNNHEALHDLLGYLKEQCDDIKVISEVAFSAKIVSPEIKRNEFSLTNDDNYMGRDLEFQVLSNAFSSSDMNVISITGIGGAGKTALVGRWIEKTIQYWPEETTGLFVWSFYENPNVIDLFQALYDFLEIGFEILTSENLGEITGSCIEELRNKKYVIVLDGIEVIQGDRRTDSFGILMDEELSLFLTSICLKNKGLLVLTSRFPLVEIQRYRGRGFTNIVLRRLSDDDGADVLLAAGNFQSRDDALVVSKMLFGHALALRVTAAASLRESEKFDFLDFLRFIKSDNFATKLTKIFQFYADRLSLLERDILSLISIFPAAVKQDRILQLATMMNVDLTSYKSEGILENLERDGLIIARNFDSTWFAHPVVREYFRIDNKKSSSAAAFVLAGRPRSSEQDEMFHFDPSLPSVPEKKLIDYAHAVVLFCEAGLVDKAWEIYSVELEFGDRLHRAGLDEENFKISVVFLKSDVLKKLSDDQRGCIAASSAHAFRRSGELSRAVELYLGSVLQATNMGQLSAASVQEFNSYTARREYEFVKREDSLAYLSKSSSSKRHSHTSISELIELAVFGISHFDRGNIQIGIKNLVASYSYMRAEPDLFNDPAINIRSFIADCFLKVDMNLQSALLYYEQSLVEGRGGYHLRSVASKMRSDAARKDFEAALGGAQKLREKTTSGNVVVWAETFFVEAEYWCEKLEYNKADLAIEKSIEILSSRGFVRKHGHAVLKRAQIKLAQGDEISSLRFLEDAGSIIDGRGYWDIENRINEVKTELDRKLYDSIDDGSIKKNHKTLVLGGDFGDESIEIMFAEVLKSLVWKENLF